nr:hypothetical protein [Gammaproteobacteria bacterium]
MSFITKSHSLNHPGSRRQLGSLFMYFSFALVLIISKSVSAETEANGSFSSLNSVADSELDRLRGGFRTPGGLEVSFGIRKLTLINGNLHIDRSLDANESSYFTDGSGKQYGDIDYTDAFHGMTSKLLKDASSQFSLTQNTLDNQLIQNISIMDIRISNLVTLRSGLSTARWIAESARDF